MSGSPVGGVFIRATPGAGIGEIFTPGAARMVLTSPLELGASHC
jgi:hypothetical protein